VPKIGRKVCHLGGDSHTSFKVKRLKLKVTRPVKTYELQTWCTDEGRRPASATGTMTSKVKVARSRDQSEPSLPNAVPVSLEAGGGIPCRPNPAATLLV